MRIQILSTVLFSFVFTSFFGGVVWAAELEPQETVAAFHAALKKGDHKTLKVLVAADALLYESGGVEVSFKEYASHHMKADIAFSKTTTRKITKMTQSKVGDAAWVMSHGTTVGTFRGKKIHSLYTETMVLRRVEGKWQIVHIHWSSHAVKKDSHSKKRHRHQK